MGDQATSRDLHTVHRNLPTNPPTQGRLLGMSSSLQSPFRPSSGYGVPKAPPISNGYGVPKAPAISSGYGVPQAPAIGSGYGVPQGPALTSGYRGPAPSSSFSIPQVSNQNNINSFTSPDSYQAQKRPNRESAEVGWTLRDFTVLYLLFTDVRGVLLYPAVSLSQQ